MAKGRRKMVQATTKPKRVRSRTGYIMVQLTAAERDKLESIRARMEVEQGVTIALAEVFRSWLRRAD